MVEIQCNMGAVFVAGVKLRQGSNMLDEESARVVMDRAQSLFDGGVLVLVRDPGLSTPDVERMTVRQIRDGLASGEWSIKSMRAMLDAEAAGRNRRTVTSGLASAIERRVRSSGSVILIEV
jgi:hypothetical protein